MERVAMRPIDPEDMRATGAFLEIGNVMFRKLPAQVEANHIKLGHIAHEISFCLLQHILFNTPRRVLKTIPNFVLGSK